MIVMNYFYKIKRIKIFPQGNIIVLLRDGIELVRDEDGRYICTQSGFIMNPLYDEDTEELVGFIG
jgi:hypothetical protein